jgi:hypothetical protein
MNQNPVGLLDAGNPGDCRLSAAEIIVSFDALWFRTGSSENRDFSVKGSVLIAGMRKHLSTCANHKVPNSQTTAWNGLALIQIVTPSQEQCSINRHIIR